MKTANLEFSRVRQSYPEPAIVMFMRLYRENRQAIIDFVILTILSIITFALLVLGDITEAFFEFSRAHEHYDLDEIVFIFLLVLAVYLPIFTIRRWIESSQRLRQANTDSLTDLFNRRKGMDVLGMEIARAKRYHRPLSVILFDIDHFKDVNDEHGHAAGDQVLRAIAKLTREKLRSIDIPIRWGGEEFMIISPETNQEEASRLAERFRTDIEATVMKGGVRVTASFGVAQLEEDFTLNDLFLRADGKLYEAKSAGRNRVV